MPGYDDWEKQVDKNATSILVNLSRKSIRLNVNIYDSGTLGSISGARVNISSDRITQTNLTNISGSVSFLVKSTTSYSLDITAPNYLARSAIIEMSTTDKVAQYLLLRANQFFILVNDRNSNTAIPEAEVRIDGTLVGKTDMRGVLAIPLERGKVYSIEIKRSSYQPYTETRDISQSDAIYTVGLSKALVGAFVSVFDENRSPVSGADVFVNGTLSGTTNQYGRLNIPTLVSGNYSIEVRKTGYVALNRTTLVTNPNEEYSYELSFENADLTLFVQDKDQKMIPNATIIMNGQMLGATDDRGQYKTMVKFNTPYNITASKDSYQPVAVQNQFAQGNTSFSVTLIMEKSLDWGLIAIIVIGAICVLMLFAALRIWGGRKHRHVMRRNDI
jgi:hypothetical protein